MRHERPEPGRPTPVEAVNASLIAQRLKGAWAVETRKALPLQLDREIRPVVLDDMVALLDEGRVNRGYADIYDLHRAGYSTDLSATLGPQAAKILDANLRSAFDEAGAVADSCCDPLADAIAESEAA
jgi:hypothetical protein